MPAAVSPLRNAVSFIGERGPDGSRCAPLVAVVKVIDVVIVEIHRLLNQPQSQKTAVEIQIFLGVIDGGRDMVQTEDGVLQEGLPDCTCFVTNVPSASGCSAPIRPASYQ